MKNILFAALPIMAALLTACNIQPTAYTFKKLIEPENIKPLSIAVENDYLWVTDVDQNSLFKLDWEGNKLEVFEDLHRPMHIRLTDQYVYIPEYGSDRIARISKQGLREQLDLPFELDAPSGLDVEDEKLIIADFYNYRIAYLNAGNDESFGQRGTEPGQLMYPTNVQFFEGNIWVADAYNHRIQVFNADGELMQVIGQADNINAATGLHVHEDLIVVTDFENSRVLLYNHQGTLIQELQDSINKPSGAYLFGDLLFVANYGDGSIAVFER